MKISDDDLLQLVRAFSEQARAEGDELSAARKKALDYIKGEMPDVPIIPGRSAYVSHDVADIITAVLPDLIDIFMAEDVASFVPNSEEDDEAAKQETDYVNHVFFSENNGFQLLYDGIKTALEQKNGYWTVDWQDEQDETERFDGMPAEEFLQYAMRYGPNVPDRQPGTPTLENVVQDPEDGTYAFDLSVPKDGRCVVTAWPPEDVFVSADTRTIGDGSYCGFRSRVPRGQLLSDGYDADLVASLPIYSGISLEDQARDQAGRFGGEIETALPNAELVEIVHHYVRYADGDGETLFRVVTGGDDDAIFLRSEEVQSIPAAGFSPFPIPFKHHGESMADKLMPIQRQKSAIYRLVIDQARFAQVGRLAINETLIGKNTIKDMMNNRPGAMIRVAGDPSQIQPMNSGALGFEPFKLLEYASTQAEERTGVTRSAMGLTPDTLHETSSGMLAMMSQGQRRVRFIARIIAETGLKPLFLAIHDCVRTRAKMRKLAQLRGKFVWVDPTKWGVRKDMSIEIGTAHGGRDYEIAALERVLALQEKAVGAQGGALDGPLVKTPNILAAMDKLAGKLVKTPEAYFPSPESYQPPPPQQPQPSPEVIKAQAEAQQAQARLQLEAQKHMDDVNLRVAQAKTDADIKVYEIDSRNQLERYKAEITASLRDGQVSHEIALKDKEIDTSAALEAAQAAMADENEKLRIALDQSNVERQMDHNHAADALNLIHEHSKPNTDVDLPAVRLGGDASE